MEIKDYLHFYIGQPVLINDNLHEGVIDTLTYLNNLGDCGGNEYEWEAKSCQLILRKLSDMTEEEANTMLQTFGSKAKNWMNVKGVYPTHIRYEFTYHSSSRKREDVFKFNEMGPEVFAHLIKQGFDLFGLCDAGLAIDSRYL